jgi:hypothetical protein
VRAEFKVCSVKVVIHIATIVSLKVKKTGTYIMSTESISRVYFLNFCY